MMNFYGVVTLHRARRAALALLTLLLVGAGPACSSRHLAVELEPTSVGEDDSPYARQLLVTFKPVDARPLHGAGSNSGPYIGPSTYTVSERTRRQVARLSKQYGLRRVEHWPIRSLGLHCVAQHKPRPSRHCKRIFR